MSIMIAVALLAGAAYALSELIQAVRRSYWSSKSHKTPLDLVEDPREAGAILLAQIALYEGDLTAAQVTQITNEIRDGFRVGDNEAGDLLAFARSSLNGIPDAANSLRKIIHPIDKACNDDERRQLVAMMTRVAQAGGDPSGVQLALINRTKHALITAKN